MLLVKILFILLIRDLVSLVLFQPWRRLRILRPLGLPDLPRMPAPEEPSQFTVHVFLNHDPMIARSLLRDLFSDFPDSAWKLPPLVGLSPRPQERPTGYQSKWLDTRKVLGRYVFPEPLPGDLTLLQLSEKLEQEFAITKKYQAQFVLFPSSPSTKAHIPRGPTAHCPGQ